MKRSFSFFFELVLRYHLQNSYPAKYRKPKAIQQVSATFHPHRPLALWDVGEGSNDIIFFFFFFLRDLWGVLGEWTPTADPSYICAQLLQTSKTALHTFCIRSHPQDSKHLHSTHPVSSAATKNMHVSGNVMHFITSASHAIMKWYMSLLYSLIFPLDVTTSFTELNRETNKQATFFVFSFLLGCSTSLSSCVASPADIL